MKRAAVLILVLSVIVSCTGKKDTKTIEYPIDGPIQLHPANQHYFLYKGKPMALITSAEHYGAVLNLDFDYKTYLKTLAEDGMNYTRIFTGIYFENEGDFGIQNNTLAPKKTSVCTPWAIVISDLSGSIKYDLNSWNEAYFQRLNDFMVTAASYNIIVEVTLFSSIYQDRTWDIVPQNPANNINISHEINRQDAQTLNNGTLWEFQEKFVRKMVKELNGFDNFFFEIQNEPWSDHTWSVYNIVNKEELVANDWTNKADFGTEESMAWQQKIASIISGEEATLSKRHLIAQNFTNYKAPIPVVNDNISIINFHYAWPEAAEWNYHYDRVLGFDESGFAGSEDQVYRRQAWQFMLSGGGLFNNLDYSFYVGQENGLGENKAPGGGSKALRNQLKVLSQFLHGFELVKMHPANELVMRSPGLIPFVMASGNETYAIFLHSVGTKNTILEMNTGDGNYRIQFLNTLTGTYSETTTLHASEGRLLIEIAIPDGELALKISKE